MKSIPCLLLALFYFSTGKAEARPVAYWPYDKMTEEADLIVIAMPVAVKDSGEKTNLPGFRQTGADNVEHPFPALGVETTFEVLAVLKGEKGLKKVVFYHLREAVPAGPQINGPGLVVFVPEEKRRYLLFLKKEKDGRYSSLAGQTDPVQAVKDLGKFP